MIRKLLVACLALLVLAAAPPTDAQTTTPRPGVAYIIPSANAAVTVITGPANGCYISNPLTASDQGIATAEPIYVNPVTTASVTGNNTNAPIAPGQSWFCIPGSTLPVSVAAKTAAHKFTVVRW